MSKMMRTRRISIVRFPVTYLLVCAFLFSAVLTAVAVLLTHRSLLLPLGSRTLQDMAAIFSGTIGSGVALAGSIVAVYLALTALRSVQRQEITDSQRFLDSYISEVYGLFVELSLAIDGIMFPVKQLLDTKAVRELHKDIVEVMKADSAHPPHNSSGKMITYEGALALVGDDLIVKFLGQLQLALQRAANAIERVSASHKASSLWHYASSTYNRRDYSIKAPPPSTPAWNPYEGLNIAGYDSLIQEGETIQGAALFIRSMAQGLTTVLEGDISTRASMINLARSSLGTYLIGAHIWRGDGDDATLYFRGELTILGILLYFGSPDMVRSMTINGRDHNLSLLIVRSMLRGVPSGAMLKEYLREHFYESLIKDSEGERIFTKHFEGIESIGTAYSGLRRYLAQIDDSDVLLSRTFMSLFTEGQRQ